RDALPGRARDSRNDVSLPGRFHVPRAPERVRGTRLDGSVQGGGRRFVTSHDASRLTGQAVAPVAARGRVWLMALVPLLLLAALLSVIVWWGPADMLRGDG